MRHFAINSICNHRNGVVFTRERKRRRPTSHNMRHWLDGLFVTHSKFAKKNLHFFFSAVQFLRISFSKITDNLENVKRRQIS